MKFSKILALFLILIFTFTACKSDKAESEIAAVEIKLSDDGVSVDGESTTSNPNDAVYTAKDIVYYEDGKDFTYGEGDKNDAHSKAEADAHKVVHITEPGTYRLSGKLSKGQIAVDLGEDAKDDEKAVVTLILDGADITCTVAPAIIFYNVYECNKADTTNATKDVDTSKAGANVIIADGTKNNINGSYVARIYKPDTVVLNTDKTEVEDAEKLHKYDGAFYSRMSMNITGGKKGDGVLDIKAENEGLDSELHLTINGGNINITSGDDGINTNEDGISVTTINGGNLDITITGEKGEGDGIDSNGWLVINGGKVTASACSSSADAGIDSDLGIHINGGTVIASGNMLDQIESGGQTYAVFNFAKKQEGETELTIKNNDGKAIAEICQTNAYTVLIYSSPKLKAGTYTLWNGQNQYMGHGGGTMMGGGMRPEGTEPPEEFKDGTRPEKPEFDFGGEREEGQEPPAFPEGATRPEKPEFDDKNQNGQKPDFQATSGELKTDFEIIEGGNMFSNITFANQ